MGVVLNLVSVKPCCSITKTTTGQREYDMLSVDLTYQGLTKPGLTPRMQATLLAECNFSSYSCSVSADISLLIWSEIRQVGHPEAAGRQACFFHVVSDSCFWLSLVFCIWTFSILVFTVLLFLFFTATLHFCLSWLWKACLRRMTQQPWHIHVFMSDNPSYIYIYIYDFFFDEELTNATLDYQKVHRKSGSKPVLCLSF